MSTHAAASKRRVPGDFWQMPSGKCRKGGAFERLRPFYFLTLFGNLNFQSKVVSKTGERVARKAVAKSLCAIASGGSRLRQAACGLSCLRMSTHAEAESRLARMLVANVYLERGSIGGDALRIAFDKPFLKRHKIVFFAVNEQVFERVVHRFEQNRRQVLALVGGA